jgi:hypothetical protein
VPHVEKMAGEGHKPGSVPRCGYPSRGDDHSSRTVVADGLKQPTRESRAGRPQTLPYLALLRMGFTKLPASPQELVSSYLTLSPLLHFHSLIFSDQINLLSRRSVQTIPDENEAVSFLWHFP